MRRMRHHVRRMGLLFSILGQSAPIHDYETGQHILHIRVSID
jgi:hypothetical protein